jgi:hypothetical protein
VVTPQDGDAATPTISTTSMPGVDVVSDVGDDPAGQAAIDRVHPGTRRDRTPGADEPVAQRGCTVEPEHAWLEDAAPLLLFGARHLAQADTLGDVPLDELSDRPRTRGTA